MGGILSPLRRHRYGAPGVYTPPFIDGQHPLDQEEDYAPDPYFPEPIRPATPSPVASQPITPDPYTPPPMSAAEQDLVRLRESAPRPERAGILRQLAAGVTGSLFPTAGTDIPGKLAYRNFDEMQDSKIAIERAAKLAEMEKARRGEGLEAFKAGTARGRADAYSRQVEQAESPTPLRPTMDEARGIQYLPVDPNKPELGYRYTRPEGYVPPAPELKLAPPGTYQIQTDPTGRAIASAIPGLPEKPQSEGAPTTTKLALRIAELEMKAPRTPQEEMELRTTKRALGLAKPDRPASIETRTAADGRMVMIIQQDGKEVSVPVEGYNPPLAESPGRPKQEKARTGGFWGGGVPAAPTPGAPAATTPRASAAPAAAPSGLMTREQFIADFIKEEDRSPTPEEIEELRGTAWQ